MGSRCPPPRARARSIGATSSRTSLEGDPQRFARMVDPAADRPESHAQNRRRFLARNTLELAEGKGNAKGIGELEQSGLHAVNELTARELFVRVPLWSRWDLSEEPERAPLSSFTADMMAGEGARHSQDT